MHERQGLLNLLSISLRGRADPAEFPSARNYPCRWWFESTLNAGATVMHMAYALARGRKVHRGSIENAAPWRPACTTCSIVHVSPASRVDLRCSCVSLPWLIFRSNMVVNANYRCPALSSSPLGHRYLVPSNFGDDSLSAEPLILHSG